MVVILTMVIISIFLLLFWIVWWVVVVIVVVESTAVWTWTGTLFYCRGIIYVYFGQSEKCPEVRTDHPQLLDSEVKIRLPALPRVIFVSRAAVSFLPVLFWKSFFKFFFSCFGFPAFFLFTTCVSLSFLPLIVMPSLIILVSHCLC